MQLCADLNFLECRLCSHGDKNLRTSSMEVDSIREVTRGITAQRQASARTACLRTGEAKREGISYATNEMQKPTRVTHMMALHILRSSIGEKNPNTNNSPEQKRTRFCLQKQNSVKNSNVEGCQTIRQQAGCNYRPRGKGWLTTQGGNGTTLFMNKLPSDGLLHQLLHLQIDATFMIKLFIQITLPL